jgi:hypothetical protein
MEKTLSGGQKSGDVAFDEKQLIVHQKSDIGHILFLRILYHIPYHGQKSDIISYPISQLKKG